jgi:hypothetical protein
MSQQQILILDCNGQPKPAICFQLELAKIDMRVVADEDEAINLLANSRMTGERYVALLVNNPYLNVDITKIVEEVMAIDIDMPILFVKESKSLKQIVQSLNIEYNRVRIFYSEPTGAIDVLNMLKERECGLINNQQVAS